MECKIKLKYKSGIDCYAGRMTAAINDKERIWKKTSCVLLALQVVDVSSVINSLSYTRRAYALLNPNVTSGSHLLPQAQLLE